MELITTVEAAKQLQLSYSYLRQLICKGKIPHIKFNNTVRFDQEELNNWIKQHRVPAKGSSFTTIKGLTDPAGD